MPRPAGRPAAFLGHDEGVRLEKHTQGEVLVVALSGRLDRDTAPHVRKDLMELVPENAPLLLDLSRLTYMSSAGLRTLLLVYRRARRNRARLALAGLAPDISEVMAVIGLLDLFRVADSLELGVEALAG